MSKSKKNVIDPSAIINSYGADTARWFMLSDSPPERDLEWTENGIAGSFKLINKIWKITYDVIHNFENQNNNNNNDKELEYITNKTVINITNNIDSFQFNKAIANIYELINSIQKLYINKTASKETFTKTLKQLALLLQPFVPHLSEEMWLSLGEHGLAINQPWPEKKEITKKTSYNIAVQINGKTKEIITLATTPDEEEVFILIKNNKKIKKLIYDKKIIRKIYVPNKIFNLVVSE